MIIVMPVMVIIMVMMIIRNDNKTMSSEAR